MEIINKKLDQLSLRNRGSDLLISQRYVATMQCNTVQSAYVSIQENIKVFLNLGSSQAITVFIDIAPSRLMLRLVLLNWNQNLNL